MCVAVENKAEIRYFFISLETSINYKLFSHSKRPISRGMLVHMLNNTLKSEQKKRFSSLKANE